MIIEMPEKGFEYNKRKLNPTMDFNVNNLKFGDQIALITEDANNLLELRISEIEDREDGTLLIKGTDMAIDMETKIIWDPEKKEFREF